MSLALIVAMSENGVIGVDNRLPWRLPADTRRFKQLTMGHHMIMGRRTWDSIGRPLPGRTSVVVTRNRDFSAPAGVVIAHSLAEAVAACAGDDEPFVIGGTELYRQALATATRIHLTVIEHAFDGDAHMPPIDRTHWQLAGSERHLDAEWPYRFEIWIRAGSPANG
jgi:dihydrofolate reductase